MDNTNETKTYLSFMIDNEYFAISVDKTLEVLQKLKFTRVPNVTDDISGVINFRGEIIPVSETRTRFGLTNRKPEDSYVVIVVEITANNTKSVIGAVCDKVKDVITIDSNDIMPVPKMTSKIKAELITGIVKRNDDFIMMLDIDKMFTNQEIEDLSELVAQ